MRMSRNKRAATREGSRSKAGTARIGFLLITASLDSFTSSSPDESTPTRDTLSVPHHHHHHHSMYHRQSQRQSHSSQSHTPAPAYNQGYGGYGGQPPPQQQAGGGYGGHQGGGGYPGYAPPPPPQRGPPPGADPDLWHWFSAVDTDRSGSITVTELQSALVNGTFSLSFVV